MTYIGNNKTQTAVDTVDERFEDFKELIYTKLSYAVFASSLALI